jgi:hypothetical protein
LSMCNVSQNFAQNRCFGYEHHALEDHQWQQMTLGQQGLFMARQGRRILGGASSSAHIPTIRGNQSRAKSPIIDTHVSFEPIWDPPLSKILQYDPIFPYRNCVTLCKRLVVAKFRSYHLQRFHIEAPRLLRSST